MFILCNENNGYELEEENINKKMYILIIKDKHKRICFKSGVIKNGQC